MHKVGIVFAAAALFAVIGIAAAAPASADGCPGNPDALGTSRTLVIGPHDYQHLGTMQYKDTLPLNDHEVVITFDDGPLPPWSTMALDILKAQCVKATFFIIGEMARAYPDVVRREYEAGQTIGTHSMTHPSGFQRLSGDKLAHQIDDGIASVSAALGNRDDLAPYFRIPGLGRSELVEKALADRSLVVFSADVVADDWFRHISPEQIVKRAMERLDKRGRGILLLHDIHPWTIEALPVLLKDLKDHGYRVVQVVPPAPPGPLIAGGPRVWARAAAMPMPNVIDEGAVSPTWPQANVQFANAADVLPAPDAAAFDVERTPANEAGTAPPGAVKWPQLAELVLPSGQSDLAVPGLAELGVSLHEAVLTATEIKVAPKLAVHMPVERSRYRSRHVRWNARSRERHPIRHGIHRAGTVRHRAALARATDTA